MKALSPKKKYSQPDVKTNRILQRGLSQSQHLEIVFNDENRMHII